MTVAMADRIEMPSPVVAAVDLLAWSAEVSASGWIVRSAVLHDRRVEDDESQQWVEAELQILEAVEQVKAWADLQGLVALRRLREAVGEQVRMTDDLSGPIGLGLPPQVLRAESDIAAVDEGCWRPGCRSGRSSAGSTWRWTRTAGPSCCTRPWVRAECPWTGRSASTTTPVGSGRRRSTRSPNGCSRRTATGASAPTARSVGSCAGRWRCTRRIRRQPRTTPSPTAPRMRRSTRLARAA